MPSTCDLNLSMWGDTCPDPLLDRKPCRDPGDWACTRAAGKPARRAGRRCSGGLDSSGEAGAGCHWGLLLAQPGCWPAGRAGAHLYLCPLCHWRSRHWPVHAWLMEAGHCWEGRPAPPAEVRKHVDSLQTSTGSHGGWRRTSLAAGLQGTGVLVHTLRTEPTEAGAGPVRLLRGQPCTACRRRACLAIPEELLQDAPRSSFAVHFLFASEPCLAPVLPSFKSA